jgi:hypothetical protein
MNDNKGGVTGIGFSNEGGDGCIQADRLNK